MVCAPRQVRLGGRTATCPGCRSARRRRGNTLERCQGRPRTCPLGVRLPTAAAAGGARRVRHRPLRRRQSDPSASRLRPPRLPPATAEWACASAWRDSNRYARRCGPACMGAGRYARWAERACRLPPRPPPPHLGAVWRHRDRAASGHRRAVAAARRRRLLLSKLSKLELPAAQAAGGGQGERETW